MTKVLLSMEAQQKFEIMEQMADKHITKATASVKIDCTLRHVRQLLNIYHTRGIAGFLHGNTGRKPAHAFSQQHKQAILSLYSNKYWGTNLTHCMGSSFGMKPSVSPLLPCAGFLTRNPSSIQELTVAPVNN